MTTQTLSRRIRAPEDILIGQYIAVTHSQYQLLPEPLEPAIGGTDIEPLRVTLIPHDAGQPMKVIALSLPFVMTELACGMRQTIDTRRHVLVCVDARYARTAKTKTDSTCRACKKRKGKRDKKRKKK